jgi:hypothetical protein
MTVSLSGCRLKLDRAYEHLETLANDIQRVMTEGDSDGVFEKFNGKKGEWIVWEVAPPIRKEWSAMVGDCVHNLRSCLDHLAWQLVLLAGNDPTISTEFPVFKDSGLFKKKAGPKMDGMSSTAMRLIEDVQPFNTRQPEAEIDDLWLIHELSNIDKHRRLHFSQFTLMGGRCRLELPPGPTIQIVEEFPGGPLEDRTVIAHFRWDPSLLPPNAEVDRQIELSFDVTFAKAPPEGPPVVDLENTGVRDLLVDLFAYLRDDLVPKFAPLFP